METVEIQERYTKKAVRALNQEESDMALQLKAMGEKLETLMGEIKDDREQRKQLAARRESFHHIKGDETDRAYLQIATLRKHYGRYQGQVRGEPPGQPSTIRLPLPALVHAGAHGLLRVRSRTYGACPLPPKVTEGWPIPDQSAGMSTDGAPVVRH